MMHYSNLLSLLLVLLNYNNMPQKNNLGLKGINNLKKNEQHLAQIKQKIDQDLGLKSFMQNPVLTNDQAQMLRRNPILKAQLQNFVNGVNIQQDQNNQALQTKPQVVEMQKPQVLAPSVKPTISQPVDQLSVKSKKAIKIKTRNWGPKFNPVAKVFKRVSGDRVDLKELREKHIQDYLKLRKTANPDYTLITKSLTESTIKYLQKRIDETVKELGVPPTNFCIFSMGSMARGESGFFTDLEIGILVNKIDFQIQTYFNKLAQKLSDRLFLLGEHPAVGGKGMRLDEADISPFHLKFYARYASPEQASNLLAKALEDRDFSKIPFEGTRVFISTVKDFAKMINTKLIDKMVEEQLKNRKQLRKKLFAIELKKALKYPKNKHKSLYEIKKAVGLYVNNKLKPFSAREKKTAKSISYLARNIRFVYGNENIFKSYLNEREKYLNAEPVNKNPFYSTLRQEIAYLKMKDDIIMHATNSDCAIVSAKLGNEIDLKREVYRFPEQMLTDLGFYYNLGVQNTIEILKELVKRGLFSEKFGKELSDAMNYVIGLRLKKQEKLRKQGYSIPVTIEQYQKIKEELTKELDNNIAGLEVLVATHSKSKSIDAINEKISKLKTELKDLERAVPGLPDSILSPDVIDSLNQKYLPILNKLYIKSLEFLKGNLMAFQD